VSAVSEPGCAIVAVPVVQRFGSYEILYELKTGGMGAVLLGRRRGPGAFEQLVAIKTILAEHAKTEAVRAMFLDEAALLARLSHPAVATVHDFGEDGHTLYMVMEYVAGIAFRDVIELAMPPTVAARAIAEACRGLHAAHEVHDFAGHNLGVVHRDISPDNLMLGFDGHVKVIDFGIALVKNRQAPVTELGTLKGKPPYMSPEQVKNEAIDRRSDVFSLAVVLWEMLTGRGLFTGDSIYAIALAVDQQEIVPPSQVIGEPLPFGLDAVVMNALDRDPARRTPSAAAFAEQLEEVIQSSGDETLEAWAARALAERRAAHRVWLASVVAGKDAPRPIGRPTGSVTALAPRPAVAPGGDAEHAPQLGRAATMLAPVAPAVVPTTSEPAAEPGLATHLPAMHPADPDDGDRSVRRGLALPIALAVIVLAVIGGGIAMLRAPSAPVAERGDDGKRAVVPIAPPDAAVIVVDAAMIAIPIDAAQIVPAPERHHTVRRAPAPAPAPAPAHPPPLPREAAPPPAVAPTPAPAEAIPAGFGKLTALHKAGSAYLMVMIDGRFFANTPMYGEPIPTGAHTIELVDVTTRKVLAHRTVTVRPDDAVAISPTAAP
jgi:hypothetical protein